MGKVVLSLSERLLPRIDMSPDQKGSHPLEIMATVLNGVTDAYGKRDKRSNAKRDKGYESDRSKFPSLAHLTSVSP
jgi:hypothetical protein